MRTALALCLIAVLSVAFVAPLLAQKQIDVNTASAIELQELYRVGPKTSAKIIAEREQNGPFSSVADLANRVSGIGPKTIARWEGVAVCIQPE